MKFTDGLFDNLDALIEDNKKEMYMYLEIVENFSDSELTKQIKDAFSLIPKQHHEIGKQVFLKNFPDPFGEFDYEDDKEILDIMTRYQVQRERIIEILDDVVSKL